VKNLDQIRARNALKASSIQVKGQNGGEVIKKIPPLVMNHGLLAAAAFGFEKGEGWQAAFNALAQHLSDPDVGILPSTASTAEGMLRFLSQDADSDRLRAATNEAMAWLNYARRFIKSKDEKAGA